MFPTAHSSVYYNEAGEPLGWDGPYEPEYDDNPYDSDFEDEEDEEETLVEFAEMVADLHKTVANHDNEEISTFNTKIYKASRELLFAAIEAAYPETGVEEIYDVWVDCGESIAYCANHARTSQMTEMEFHAG